jgi:endonuclease YncB( thermonuclease family)
MTTDDEPGAEGRRSGAGSVDPPRVDTVVTRERVKELLQAEIDKQAPLDEARLAAAILAESSIRFTDEPGTTGYAIVGPDGAPRTTLHDGQTVPFTLQDLAAKIRTNYPMLFKPEGPETRPAGNDAHDTSAPRRDWLLVASEEGPETVSAHSRDTQDVSTPLSHGAHMSDEKAGEPAQDSRRAPWRDALRNAHARMLGVRTKTSAEETESKRRAGASALEPFASDVPSRVRFRPSYALYAAVLLAVGAVIAFNISGPSSQPPSASGAGEQAKARAGSGPAATGTVASGAAGTQPDAIAGTAEVVDTSTLRVDGKLVRLFGVEWARGGKVEDLAAYIAGREVTCTPAARSDRHRCHIDGRDLSRVVLYNGGGRATADATPELKAAEEDARAASLGVWEKP